MTIFGKEPAVIIGFVVAAVIAVIQTALGHGFISDALAGRLTDLIQSLGNLLTLAAPIVAGLVIRSQVSSPATVAGHVDVIASLEQTLNTATAPDPSAAPAAATPSDDAPIPGTPTADGTLG